MCLWPNGISGETSVIYKLFNAENSEIISNAANPAGQILVDLNGNGTKKIRINLPEPTLVFCQTSHTQDISFSALNWFSNMKSDYAMKRRGA